MKKQMMKFAMLVAVMTTIIISCNKKEETVVKEETAAVDKDKIKAEIVALETAYADAMNAGNAEAVSAYYADDAVSFGQNEPPANGKAAILEALKKDVSDSKGLKAGFSTNEVHVSSDGVQVVEIGSYTVSDSTNTVKYTGNFMAVFEKRDGKYVCVRDISASDKSKDEKK